MPKENKSQILRITARVFIILGLYIPLILSIQILFYFLPGLINNFSQKNNLIHSLLSNSIILLVGSFVLSIVGLTAGIGLESRKEWARKLTIIILLLGILWVIIGLLYQIFILPEHIQEIYDIKLIIIERPIILTNYVQLISILTLVFLYLVVLKELTSDSVKKEFRKQH